MCPASLFALLSRLLNQFISGSDDFISCGSRQPLSGVRGKIGPGTIRVLSWVGRASWLALP